MKKLGILVMAMVMVFGLSLGAMAELDNPWTNDGAEVNVDIKVSALGEVWSSIGTGQARNGDSNITLDITNGAGQIPQAGRAEDTIGALANVDYNVNVDLEGTIPDYSMFHILVGINNRGNYNGVGQHTSADADTILTWDRRDGSWHSNPNNPLAFTGVGQATAKSVKVDYAAEARHGMPDMQTVDDLQVVWTISSAQ